jgi:hypothetical protein
MAYFVVTEGLSGSWHLRRRASSTPLQARVGARLDFDDLQLEKDFSAMKACRHSKLCNILFTREQRDRQLVRPGFVATRSGDQSGGCQRRNKSRPAGRRKTRPV